MRFHKAKSPAKRAPALTLVTAGMLGSVAVDALAKIWAVSALFGEGGKKQEAPLGRLPVWEQAILGGGAQARGAKYIMIHGQNSCESAGVVSNLLPESYLLCLHASRRPYRSTATRAVHFTARRKCHRYHFGTIDTCESILPPASTIPAPFIQPGIACFAMRSPVLSSA